ncbi:MAG: FAD-dependent oxidoreductase [Propionivibrio sp.]|uniref:FAD-dependent oxidoreductase n=1 Tax=Candidatus Propionivibrio dominans TaxID=2954373 RepID=A0A9D7F8D1_9RHOO|nr:FAD-dependent oxidoreductase [Candidatus Propionivibrio dominans]
MEKIGAVVIGAWIIGMACARTLAQRGIDTVILEQHDTFGSETSARNSEVIHAGFYYPVDPIKAELCVAGRHLLYEFYINHVVSQLAGIVINAAGLSAVRVSLH